jgi:hypothetical protein
MKISRLIVLGLYGLAMIIGLAGCIISASPNPQESIVMKVGDSKTFSVEGPTEIANVYKYNWYLIGNGFTEWKGNGKKYDFIADPQKYQLYNRMTVECQLSQYILVYVNCSGCQAGDSGWHWYWITVDKKIWNIKIVQDTPVWQGSYVIEDNTDISLLNGFTTITGNLYIKNTKRTNLAGLENLTSVGGELSIRGNNALKNLTGLENLKSVGDLVIESNTSIINLTGLENLSSFGKGLYIGWNYSLISLSALESISSVVGDLYISGNDALTSLTGLEKISSVGGDLSIGWSNHAVSDGNDALTSLSGLENITSVGGNLIINSNDSLTSLSGLENITSIGGNLKINYTPLTSLFGLENLTSVVGDLIIEYNTALTSLSGPDNITSVGGDLYIHGNFNLPSLSGLEKLTLVGGLDISWNPVLTSLTGLENITSIGEDLLISQNPALTSLSGLENITTVGGDLYIGSGFMGRNYALTSLGMTGLQRVNGDFEISSNPLLCKSLAEELRDQVLSRQGIGGNKYIYSNKDCMTP